MSQLPNRDDSTGSITSIDAKIIQYKYSIYKLNKVIPQLKKVAETPDKSRLPLCHYITLIFGNTFSINEGGFGGKLELISTFKLFKFIPVTISPMATHIPYDANDTPVKLLQELPPNNVSYKCLKLLEGLCQNCLNGYEKRLHLAKLEKGAGSDQLLVDIDNILSKDIFKDDNDIDINLIDNFFFNTPDEKSSQNINSMEATIIDMDFKALFLITTKLKESLTHLIDIINKFKKIKSQPKLSQDKYLTTFINWKMTLHKLMAVTLRLNDLYIIQRRFGRKVYLSNYQHLFDQKLLQQCTNGNYFKLQILSSIDELYNGSKKNGTLIATLTRFIRQNAKYDCNSKTVLDFNNFISQGCASIENAVNKLEELGYNWITAELKFRKMYDVPTEFLNDFYESLIKQNEAEEIKDSQSKSEKFPSIDDATTKNVKKKNSNERSVFNRPSRSSSVSSDNSSTAAAAGRQIPNSNRNSLLIPQNKSMDLSPRLSRPNSMLILNSNSPIDGTNSNSKLNHGNETTTGGRRRSNSQPHSILENSPTAAASGAAAALKNNIRSPSGSIRRLSSQSQKSPNRSNLSPSPSVKKTQQPSQQPIPQHKAQKDELHASKPLTANQRLQLHLRQAAKSGTLMTQEKEILSSVVFDPNSPSSVNLKRYSEHVNDPGVLEDKELLKLVEKNSNDHGRNNELNSSVSPFNSESKPRPKKKSSRDQVTKMNTKLNGEMNQLSIDSNRSSTFSAKATASESSSNLSDLNTIMKKVRFTGVPEYTEAEDAPAKYSAKILKNFAVFKTPVNKPGFRKKDQQLKKEESLSFKTQLQLQSLDGINFPSQPPSNSQLSKIKRKIL